jgi:hypothetical protein
VRVVWKFILAGQLVAAKRRFAQSVVPKMNRGPGKAAHRRTDHAQAGAERRWDGRTLTAYLGGFCWLLPGTIWCGDTFLQRMHLGHACHGGPRGGDLVIGPSAQDRDRYSRGDLFELRDGCKLTFEALRAKIVAGHHYC